MPEYVSVCVCKCACGFFICVPVFQVWYGDFFRIHFYEFVQACVYKMCVRLYFCMCLLLLRTVSVLMHC